MPAFVYPATSFLVAAREVANINFYRVVDHLIVYFDERYPELQLCYQYDVFVALNVLLEHLRHHEDEEMRNIYRPLMLLKQHVASLRHANLHSKLEYQDMSFTKPGISRVLQYLPDLIERFTMLQLKHRASASTHATDSIYAVGSNLWTLYQQYHQICVQYRVLEPCPPLVQFLAWSKGEVHLLVPQGKSLAWYREHHLESVLKDRTLNIVSGPWAGQQCYMLRSEIGLVLNRKTSKCENLSDDTLLTFDNKK